MDKKKLEVMELSELTAMCRCRDIKVPSNTNKPLCIRKLLSFCGDLNFQSLKKEQLIIEAKAAGIERVSKRNKNNIVHKLMNNGMSPKKRKSKRIQTLSLRSKRLQKRDTNKNSNSNSNTNSNSKAAKSKSSKKRVSAKKSTKLAIKQEAVRDSLNTVEGVLVNVFKDLQDGFKPVDTERELSHAYVDYEDKKTIAEPLAHKLDDFGDRLLDLLPLILEAESIVHNVQEYQQRVRRNALEKQVFYLAMKKYKKRKEYENDEVGPIAAVFEDIDEFDDWKNDKQIKKKYGTQIKRIKFVQTAKKSSNKKTKGKEEADADADGFLSEAEIESPPSRKKSKERREVEEEEEESDVSSEEDDDDEEEEEEDGSIASAEQRDANQDMEDVLLSTEDEDDQQQPTAPKTNAAKGDDDMVEAGDDDTVEAGDDEATEEETVDSDAKEKKAANKGSRRIGRRRKKQAQVEQPTGETVPDEETDAADDDTDGKEKENTKNGEEVDTEAVAENDEQKSEEANNTNKRGRGRGRKRNRNVKDKKAELKDKEAVAAENESENGLDDDNDNQSLTKNVNDIDGGDNKMQESGTGNDADAENGADASDMELDDNAVDDGDDDRDDDEDEDSDIAMDDKKSAKQHENKLSRSTRSRRKANKPLAGQKRNRSQTDEDIDKSKPELGRDETTMGSPLKKKRKTGNGKEGENKAAANESLQPATVSG